MTDVHEPEIRSYNMSQIRSKNTKPEMIVRKYLFKMGFRYRLHVKDLPGKPDIVLPKFKTAIFVNGCFWHGHENCEYFKIPSTRTDWWKEKIEKNILNDGIKQSQLKRLGFKVIVVWECQIKNKSIYSTLIKDVKSEKS
jgi:DNA mismatch endonuclease, patch repair protein